MHGDLTSHRAYFLLNTFCNRRNNALGVKIVIGNGKEIWESPTQKELGAIHANCYSAGFEFAQVLKTKYDWEVIVFPRDFSKWVPLRCDALDIVQVFKAKSLPVLLSRIRGERNGKTWTPTAIKEVS